MRFVINQTGLRGERVGLLSGFLRSNVSIETPTAALLTQGGSVVHLTAEVLGKVFTNPQLLWLPLSNTIQLEAGVEAQNEGVAKFAGLQQHMTCVTLHNVSEETPCGHFESDKVPLWSKRGKTLISADRYMDIMEVFKPDVILAIADGRTTLKDGNKRIVKAVDRTCNLLKTCVQRFNSSKHLQGSSLIGVVVGAGNLQKCEECVQHILKYADNLDGISLQGITDASEDSLNIEEDKIQEVLQRVGGCLPTHLVKLIEGAWNPAMVLTSIEHGWDVFDGSYVVKLTNAGLAMKLNFDLQKENDSSYILDMSDECYKEDFSPILENCECLACKKHTRAYICHLLNTREMLASVLLNIHNLHHFDQMFVHARRHIASKTFAAYKQHITKQCNHYKTLSYRHKGLNAEENCNKTKKPRIHENVTD